jgi:CBS-domain-containing membrane protein
LSETRAQAHSIAGRINRVEKSLGGGSRRGAGAALRDMRQPADDPSPLPPTLPAGRPKRRRQPPQRLLAGFLGTTFALLGCVALLRLTEHPWLLPSLGGSCVILFGMARGVMAQPRSFLGGHLLATLVGLGFRLGYVSFGGPIELWAAAAVGAALTAMAATRTLHSPAGANPLVVFAEQAGPGFLFAPLLPGLAVLFGVAFVVNNLARPWGVGPWPRFHRTSPRRRAVADSVTTPGGKRP